MGIVIWNNQGIGYHYFLVGKSQLFLGKKADLNSLNLQNPQKGIGLVDMTFDKAFVKCLQGVHDHAGYLNPSKRKNILKKELVI